MTLEEMQEQLLNVQAELNNVKANNENLQKIVDEKTKRETELMEHNQKLFLRITDKKEEKQKEKELDVPFVLDKETSKLLNEKELNELNELLEEE